MSNLVHFKVTTCKSVQPTDVCEYLFDKSRRFMCVAHPKSKKKQAGGSHWHFQGHLSIAVSFNRFEEYLSEMASTHAMRSVDPKSRPVKRCKKQCDYTGFQYMIRYGRESVVASNFTVEEQDELIMKSRAYVEELKDDGFNHLQKSLDFTGPPEAVHKRARLLVYEFYSEHKEVLWPPNVQKLILYWMGKLAKEKSSNVRAMAEYISERM